MSFLKAFLASLVGVLVGLAVFTFLGFFVISGIISNAVAEKVPQVKDKTVLEIDLSRGVADRVQDDPFSRLAGGAVEGYALLEVLNAIEYAKNDDRIEGIYLHQSFVLAGQATIDDIYEALEDFKESDKFIVAYSELLTESALYLGSLADEVYLHPKGGVEWDGLAATPMFYAGMLDKVGVEPRVFKVGTYKSAVEPFTERKMSPASREQTQVLLDDMWDYRLERFAKNRGMTVAQLDEFASNLSLVSTENAAERQFVDELLYEDQVTTKLKERTGMGDDEKLRTMSLGDYIDAIAGDVNGYSTNRIAIVYTPGTIGMGPSSAVATGGESTAAAIRKAREDDKVKAIILRVNSPGGQVLASELIRREVELAAEVKPVIASYGDLAASGGYWISAGADHIIAQPTTITGSIGIFGLLFEADELLNEKMGITTDRVTTNQHSDLLNPFRDLHPAESAYVQNQINQGYGDFIGLVQEARDFPDSASVDAIAQGRVWSGKRAIDINLVDELGGFKRAIEIAVERAGLGDDYQLVAYPKLKSGFEQLNEMFGGARLSLVEDYLTAEQLALIRFVQMHKQGAQPNGFAAYAYLPYSMDIK